LGDFDIEGMVYLQLNSNGHLKPKSAFGLDLHDTQIADREYPLHELNPCSQAIKEEKIIVVENLHESKQDYGNICLTVIPEYFNSLAAFPISYGARVIGSMFAISPRKKLNSPQFVELLEAIAKTVGSLLLTLPRENGNGRVDEMKSAPRTESFTNRETVRKDRTEMTERQRVILQMIADGRTNADIADLLGYSESLIRQETIRIYAILGCSGRAEAAAIYRASLAGANKSA
jgi:DNA-binding CsgD family transcriptional regulator